MGKNLFLIDTHAHMNFNAYKDDRDEVIGRALDKGIWMINVGSQYDTSKRAVEIADKYDKGVYAAIGVHPIHLFEVQVDEGEVEFRTRAERFDESRYQGLVDGSNKVVAVGEVGLDYYHQEPSKHLNIKTSKQGVEQWKEMQKQELVKQLEFANKNKLPVILHCRGKEKNSLDAYSDLLNILSTLNFKLSTNPGVLHCFVGNTGLAQKFIDLGFYIGFTGIITFGKNADSIREVVKNIPIEKILVETDCPYLAPDPYRGERNEPAYVEYMAKKVAEIKGMRFEEAAEILVGNSKKLFRI